MPNDDHLLPDDLLPRIHEAVRDAALGLADDEALDDDQRESLFIVAGRAKGYTKRLNRAWIHFEELTAGTLVSPALDELDRLVIGPMAVYLLYRKAAPLDPSLIPIRGLIAKRFVEDEDRLDALAKLRSVVLRKAGDWAGCGARWPGRLYAWFRAGGDTNRALSDAVGGRQGEREFPHEEIEQIRELPTIESAATVAERRELLYRLTTCMNECLADAERIAVKLRIQEGRTWPAIADEMDMPESTVKTFFMQGLGKLRNCPEHKIKLVEGGA